MGHGPDLVEKVRKSVDIVTLISESVPLKKSGRKYRGLCPFHSEKTPSFYIDETKQLFYCFGCGTGGDTFKYVMLRENVEFPEAVRLLARRAGIAVPDLRGGARASEREALTSACRAAAELYRRILDGSAEGAPGREYLDRRGIGAAAREALQLGYAPDRWDTAREALARQGFRPEVLLAAGLLQRREDGGGLYDRFRGRILFPILNLTGDVIGFGGRIVGEGEPKYLNSPETLLYNKRENLYGLHHARQALKEAGEAVVVEGYLDWASLFQAGVRNAVATLGTSFTDEQASLLRRFTEKVVVNFDADAAGASATRRALEGLLARGFNVRVLQLPHGKDPDAFLRSASPEAYRELVAAAPSCFEFLVDAASRTRDLSDPAELAAAVREVVPVLAQIPGRIERSRYVALLAERLRVEDALLLAEIRDALHQGARGAGRAAGSPAAAPGPGRPKAPPAPLREAEVVLVRGLIENEAARAELLAEILPSDLEGFAVSGIVARLAEMDRDGEEIGYETLAAALADRDKDLLARIGLRGDPAPGGREVRDSLDALRRARLVRERDAVQKEMEGTREPARLGELMRRKLELSRRIDAMS
jgi:DNA primase